MLRLQVTTHSRLLIASDAVQLAKLIGLKRDAVILRSLQAFNTEQQFCTMLKYGHYYSLLSLYICNVQGGPFCTPNPDTDL